MNEDYYKVMTRYAVAKKVTAIEWVFVEGETEEDAILKAKENKNITNSISQLEFMEYQELDTWFARDISKDCLKPSDIGTHT